MRHFDIDAILAGYIECELWTAIVRLDDDDDVHADSLDFEPCPDSMGRARADIEQFLDDEVQDICERRNIDDGQIGHDFSLTRNHHGAGFWDRGHGYDGQRLTDIAHTFGETSWFVEGDTLRLE